MHTHRARQVHVLSCISKQIICEEQQAMLERFISLFAHREVRLKCMTLCMRYSTVLYANIGVFLSVIERMYTVNIIAPCKII